MAQPGLFEFRNRTRVMYGIGCRKEAPYEFEQLGAKRVLIITDMGIRKAGIMEMVSKVLKDSSIELMGIYDGILQDARVGPINEAAAMMRETGADGVIALGGGSVMDSVKAVVHMIGHGRDDFQELMNNPIFDFKPLMPHVAMPTTSGTGCEVTYGGVIYNEKEKSKGGFMDTYSSSDVAILDPELVVNLPPKITAFTGMDALTHAIEAYTSNTAQPFGDAVNLYAIKMVAKALPKAVKDGKDLEARGDMMVAACLAGIGIMHSMTGAVHATAHALGGRFGIPHGLANSIMLPWVMEANLETCFERYRDIAQAMGKKVERLSVEKAGPLAIDCVRKLKKETGLEERLKNFGITEEKMNETGLVDLAMGDSQFCFNPKDLDFNEVKELYLKAL